VITESRIGGSKEYLAGADAQISQRFVLIIFVVYILLVVAVKKIFISTIKLM
jgi:hypothetical protein